MLVIMIDNAEIEYGNSIYNIIIKKDSTLYCFFWKMKGHLFPTNGYFPNSFNLKTSFFNTMASIP